MIKKLLSLAFCLSLFLVQSCTSTSNGVTPALYTTWKDRDPFTKIDNSIVATKKGEACVTNILMLAAFGDSSIETAKKEGDIKNVAYIDRTYKAFAFYFPFFQEGCTVVRGN